MHFLLNVRARAGVAGLSAEIGYVLVVVAVIFLVIAFLTGRGPVPPVG